MFSIIKENSQFLRFHNIRISELNAMDEMTNPRKVIHLPKVRMLSRVRASIRITNVQSIKPPDPELVKKQEEEKLRNKAQKEIASRNRSCGHRLYECLLPVVTGRAYCARHILEDITAPYKQCSHVNSSGTRCSMPAPVDKEQGLCFDHARAVLLSRQRSVAPPPPVTTSETLLNKLQHYIKPERTRTTSCASSVSVVSDPADHEPTTHAVDPFREIEATLVNASVSMQVMECASASESDCDSITVDRTSDHSDQLSDYEDAPCEDRPLWRAGVFTAEETISEARDVLKLMQSSYVGQMSRLRVLLHLARQRYLRSLKSEKEVYCSINSQARGAPLTVRERRQLRRLKCYASYHRRHGVEAVLARKLHKKRAKVNEIPSNRGNHLLGKCTYQEGGVRCLTQTLPAAKHCFKHVLHDMHQVLFVACEDTRGEVPCREPIARLPVPSKLCRYHTGPPAYTTFTLKKGETDSEGETNVYSESEDVPKLETLNGSSVPDVMTE